MIGPSALGPVAKLSRPYPVFSARKPEIASLKASGCSRFEIWAAGSSSTYCEFCTASCIARMPSGGVAPSPDPAMKSAGVEIPPNRGR